MTIQDCVARRRLHQLDAAREKRDARQCEFDVILGIEHRLARSSAA
jgi:hypothetical protein